MKTERIRDSGDWIEVWSCPRCTFQATRGERYGNRGHWEQANHHHLSRHFTIEELERLSAPSHRAPWPSR